MANSKVYIVIVDNGKWHNGTYVRKCPLIENSLCKSVPALDSQTEY